MAFAIDPQFFFRDEKLGWSAGTFSGLLLLIYSFLALYTLLKVYIAGKYRIVASRDGDTTDVGFRVFVNQLFQHNFSMLIMILLLVIGIKTTLLGVKSLHDCVGHNGVSVWIVVHGAIAIIIGIIGIVQRVTGGSETSAAFAMLNLVLAVVVLLWVSLGSAWIFFNLFTREAFNQTAAGDCMARFMLFNHVYSSHLAIFIICAVYIAIYIVVSWVLKCIRDRR